MSIKVINGGLLTTLQDSGRYGMQAGGMQVSGVMDYPAALLANLLVGNKVDFATNPFGAPMAAVLESTFAGPELEFQQDALVVVTGGVPQLQLDGHAVAPYKALVVRQGQRLKVVSQKQGMRAYIAVAGGIEVPEVQGSRSTNLKLKLGGWQGRKLLAGDILPMGKPEADSRKMLAGQLVLPQAQEICAGLQEKLSQQEPLVIRIIPGPQQEYFSSQELEKFAQEIYTISNDVDRMGYRLEGRPVEKKLQQDLITDGIVFGSIQIPPNGQPIIMLADHQTTGGYPKIATVATVDLPLLAQAMPGQKIQFAFVTVQTAQGLLRQWADSWQKLAEEICDMTAEKSYTGYSPKAKRYQMRVNGQSYDVVVEPLE